MNFSPITIDNDNELVIFIWSLKSILFSGLSLLYYTCYFEVHCVNNACSVLHILCCVPVLCSCSMLLIYVPVLCSCAMFLFFEWHLCSFQIRIWAQPDMYEQTEYALDFTEQAYEFFGRYFGTPEIVHKAGEIYK